jgi:hypothetical protein
MVLYGVAQWMQEIGDSKTKAISNPGSDELNTFIYPNMYLIFKLWKAFHN